MIDFLCCVVVPPAVCMSGLRPRLRRHAPQARPRPLHPRCFSAFIPPAGLALSCRVLIQLLKTPRPFLPSPQDPQPPRAPQKRGGGREGDPGVRLPHAAVPRKARLLFCLSHFSPTSQVQETPPPHPGKRPLTLPPPPRPSLQALHGPRRLLDRRPGNRRVPLRGVQAAAADGPGWRVRCVSGGRAGWVP